MYSDEHFSDKDDFGAETFEASGKSKIPFDVINIEYQYESDFDEMNPSDSLLNLDYEMTVSVKHDENKHFSFTKDAIRAELESYISRQQGEPVKVVDFTAFYAGTNDPLRGNYGDYEAETFDAESNLSEATLKRLEKMLKNAGVWYSNPTISDYMKEGMNEEQAKEMYNLNYSDELLATIGYLMDYAHEGGMKIKGYGAESNLSEATLKRLRRTYDTYEDTNQHTANYLLLATFFGTDAEKDEVKKIMKRRDRRGYLTQEESDWMYKNINPYYDHLRNVKAAETFEASEKQGVCDTCGRKRWWFENKRGEISGQVCGYGYTYEKAKKATETGIPADFCRGMVHNPFIKNAETFEAKGIDTFAKPFEEIGIPKTYARLGVITAGITALAFGVMKLKDR